MDITFSCDKCGQSIVIDEAGAGITIDCPNCRKPVYVPSGEAPSAQNGPMRIETPSAKPRPTATPISPVPSRPVGLSYGSTSNVEHPTSNAERGGRQAERRNDADVHPSIIASLRCLIIGAVLSLISFIAIREDYIVGVTIFWMALPFFSAAPWCAIYGMCIGEVNRGLLLLAAMSVGIAIGSWIFFKSIPLPTDMQRQIEQQMRQFMH